MWFLQLGDCQFVYQESLNLLLFLYTYPYNERSVQSVSDLLLQISLYLFFPSLKLTC